MPSPGEQADVLRSLGRFLDQEGAVGFQIYNNGEILSVAWDQGPRTMRRAYMEHQVGALRAQARTMRRQPLGGPPGSLSELMRTIGQELDQGQIQLTGLVRDVEGFRVSGLRGGTYVTQLYRTPALLALSTERQSSRGEADPFREVRAGDAVYSLDMHLIGKVGAVQGRFFKVGTPRLQRDFWLAAMVVGGIGEQGQVLLTVRVSELDAHKLFKAPKPV
jgi:hypothetical protein